MDRRQTDRMSLKGRTTAQTDVHRRSTGTISFAQRRSHLSARDRRECCRSARQHDRFVVQPRSSSPLWLSTFSIGIGSNRSVPNLPNSLLNAALPSGPSS